MKLKLNCAFTMRRFSSPVCSLVVLLIMYNCNDSNGLIIEGISDGLSRPGKPTRSHKSCSPFEVNMKVYQTP